MRSRSKTYNSWRAMHSRCGRPKDISFKLYGGRGICVCKEWADYSQFLKDMGERPEGTTLDRIDGNKGYSKENCRWATQDVQLANRRPRAGGQRTYELIAFDGKALSPGAWARERGLGKDTVYRRLRNGKTALEAVTAPGLITGDELVRAAHAGLARLIAEDAARRAA